LLDELATRMKTRVATRVEPSLGSAQSLTPNAAPLAGVAVVSGANNALAQCRWLLNRGATEVFLLPEQNVQPQRVLIHWTDEQARRATLAVAASVLRHVTAEAVTSGFCPAAHRDCSGLTVYANLLDARSEAASGATGST